MLCKGSPLLLIPTYDPASWNEHFSQLRMRVRHHFGEQVKIYKPYDHIIKDLASLSLFMAMPLHLSPQPSTSCSLGSTPVLMIESIEHKIYHFGHFTVHRHSVQRFTTTAAGSRLSHPKGTSSSTPGSQSLDFTTLSTAPECQQRPC